MIRVLAAERVGEQLFGFGCEREFFVVEPMNGESAMSGRIGAAWRRNKFAICKAPNAYKKHAK